jgi:hypothetical protein
MKRFLQDLDTIASYYLFYLCLSVLPSAVMLRTLVVFGMQSRQASKLFRKRKTCANFCRCEMDVILILVAPKCWVFTHETNKSRKLPLEARQTTWSSLANRMIRFGRDRRQSGAPMGFDEEVSPLTKRRLVGEGT